MDKSKDFEKGWEEYKAKINQAIYEIASTLAPCNIGGCEKCRIKCTYHKYAKELYEAGYRKIPENAVVLTEERNKIICDRFAQLERVQAELQELNAKYYNEAKDLRRQVKKVRKETAEKFAERLLHKDNIFEEKDNSYLFYKEEIDKICKEITEGKV